MPIDPSLALGHELPEYGYSYTPDQVILYHLGIGAGVPATAAGELAYTYEKDLKVLPSFAVIPPMRSGKHLNSVPGLDFDYAKMLHGEQALELHRPIPTSGTVVNQSRVAEIWDKGKAAVVVQEIVSTDETGAPLFTTRSTLFMRGAGGFGGEPGPKAVSLQPDRAPDGVISQTTLAQQALIYRLSGDKNPLHVDPDAAKLGGFDTPIIHGLCSHGIVCKALVDQVLGGDVTRVRSYRVRFAGVGYPGETYQISYWTEGNRILANAASKERNAPIISNAVIELIPTSIE